MLANALQLLGFGAVVVCVGFATGFLVAGIVLGAGVALYGVALERGK